ncbi:hypothetical protein CDAR_68471 [Caerostris darwini]|uniref:Uncharacterized protein n=1 Tax=Caerostris darwini TaxID=1538125 RepID=A0AAV4PPL2_9ARAC|nr:hypothetical protein CDAR_68471 [Caerostris darwini]
MKSSFSRLTLKSMTCFPVRAKVRNLTSLNLSVVSVNDGFSLQADWKITCMLSITFILILPLTSRIVVILLPLLSLRLKIWLMPAPTLVLPVVRLFRTLCPPLHGPLWLLSQHGQRLCSSSTSFSTPRRTGPSRPFESMMAPQNLPLMLLNCLRSRPVKDQFLQVT